MKHKKILSSFITAALLASSLSMPGITAFAEVKNKIDLTGKTLSGGSSWNNQNPYGNAFDGNTDTFFDGDKGSYCQADLGKVYDISKISCYPRDGRVSNKGVSEYVKRMNGSTLSGSLDGTNWTVLYTFTGLTEDRADASAVKWYDADLPEKCSYRYIKWENATIEANIAEIEIYGTEAAEQPDPESTPQPTPTPAATGFTLLDRTDWKAETNSQQATSGGNSVGMVLDGDTGTIWHSSWTNAAQYDPDTNPVYLTIDMCKTQSVSGIRYTPRTKGDKSGDINGVITAYEVYVSGDNNTWTKAGDGNMGYTKDGEQVVKDIIFNPVECRYVKLVVKGNLDNNNAYVGSCAEFDVYQYNGKIEDHPMTAETAKLDTVITKLNSLTTTHQAKQELIAKANALKTSGTIDGIQAFINTADPVTDALGWMDDGVDDVYISRIMTMLSENSFSASALEKANTELSGFYRMGAEAKAKYEQSWQDEFTMSPEEESMPLYDRIKNAITRAKARIDSGDGRDYKMLKELVSYASGKYAYTGYENAFGMSADRCEAIVNNINFTLANLEKMDAGKLSTELTTYKSGEIWLDTLGSKISAHGGQIIKQGDTYYWYGEDNKIAYELTTGVSCYSSKDLKNWTYEGIAFKAFDDGTQEQQFTKEFLTDSINGTQGRIERPKVIYNEKTGKYVMWMHLEKDGGYSLSAMGVAVSDSPTGPFIWHWYGRPVCDNYVISNSKHHFFRDMNLFVDDDKEAYLFVSSENNQVMYVIRLNDDYTWIDADDLESSGTTEKAIEEGKVITPDMTVSDPRNGGYLAASYTYGKKSFTRYQLASGGAATLTKKKVDGADAKDENGNQIYISTRPDGKLCIPEYADGRWARVGQNIAEANKEPEKTETIVNNNTTLSREAPAPIRIGDTYYLVTSALSGWKANPSLTQTTDNILGTWTSIGNPITGDGPANKGQWSQNADRSTSFNSQSTCIIQLPDGSYMYMGDRWKNGVYVGTPDVDVKASTYVWLPITFENGNLTVRWSDSWTYGSSFSFDISDVQTFATESDPDCTAFKLTVHPGSYTVTGIRFEDNPDAVYGTTITDSDAVIGVIYQGRTTTDPKVELLSENID